MNKIILNKKALKYTLEACRKVITTGSVFLPILKHIRFEGDGTTLKIGGSCIEVYVESTFDSEFTGSFCVNLKDLVKVLKTAKTSKVEMEYESDGSKLKIGNYVLPTMDTEEFPCTEISEVKEVFSMDADKMISVLKRSKIFMSDDETKPHMNGINMKLYSDDTVRFEAVDGHRLITEVVSAIPEGLLRNGENVFISADAVVPLMYITKESDIVEVFENGEQTLFKVRNSSLTVKKIKGSFPDFDKVIPSESTLTCEVNREEMMEAMKGALEVSNGSEYAIKVTLFNILLDKVKISIEVDGIGFEKEMECKTDISDGIKVGFNAKFIKEAMEILSGDTVLFEFKGSLDGMKIIENRITVVVMPVVLR